MDARDKVIKLLKLARDRGEDSPEGETAARIAKEMMEEHDIEVDLDASEEQERITTEWLVEAEEPVPWMEMLVVTLCDLIYGGVVMPMISPASWKVYVVSADGDEVDINLLAFHFAYLQQYIERLLEPLEAHGSEHDLKSFSLGLVYGITEMMLMDQGVEEPTEADMPFMAPALAAAPATKTDQGTVTETAIVRQHDSFAATLEDNLDVFRDAQPEPPPSADPPPTDPTQPPEVETIHYDWHLFQEGRRTAHRYIPDPYPPEEVQAQQEG